MKTEDITKELGLDDSSVSHSTKISIHTIDLPQRAPKHMLMEIKKILETFPGKEKIQLKALSPP